MRADARQPIRCETCVYFAAHKAFPEAAGTCRYNPPVVWATSVAFGSDWPAVERDAWCARWRSTTGDLFGNGPERPA